VSLTVVTASFREWRPDFGWPVSIALAPPKDMPEAKSWPVCWLLAPRWRYFRAPFEEFDREYVSQLERYGVKRIHGVLAMLAKQAGADRLTLCCHEPAEVAEIGCHRRLAAGWWLHATGEPWPEATTRGEN
jgi:hypothetical protein